MERNQIVVFVLCTVLIAACAKDEAEKMCEPDQTASCACSNGNQGVKICTQDGQSWGVCTQCGGNQDGALPTADQGTDQAILEPSRSLYDCTSQIDCDGELAFVYEKNLCLTEVEFQAKVADLLLMNFMEDSTIEEACSSVCETKTVTACKVDCSEPSTTCTCPTADPCREDGSKI